MSEQEVISHVLQLHSNPATVAASNAWLSRFQKHPQAWTVAHSLLTNPQVQQLEVRHFAAQTLCAKVQAGLESLGDARNAFKDVIIQLITAYRAGPPVILRQLALALCAYTLHTVEWKDAIPDIGAAFMVNPELYPCLVEVFSLFPEEVGNKRVLIPSGRRAMFGYEMLSKTQFVFDALISIMNVSRTPEMERKVLKCFGSWLGGQWGVIAIPTDNYTHPFLPKLGGNPLMALAFERLPSDNLDVCCTCADVLSELFTLTNEFDAITEPLIIRAFEAIVALSHHIQRMSPQSPDFLEYCKALSRLLGELAEVHYPNFMYANKPEHQPLAQAMVQAALHMISIQNVELGEAALDFWYNLLSHHLCTPEQILEEIGPSDEEPRAKAQRIEEANRRRAFERQFLVPLYQQVIHVLCMSVRYPEVPPPDFDVEEFAGLREQYAISLTEACVVVGHEWVLDLVGGDLMQCSAKSSNGEFKWNEVEGNLFMLTTVAPRAPAGKDKVIPNVLEVVPSMFYPDNGVGALLLRAGVGRLIHYTAGYLGADGALCLKHFEFMAHKLLPSLVQVRSDDSSLKSQCETTIVTALYILVAEGARHLCSMGANVLSSVVHSIGVLINNTQISLDSRANLVMAAGAAVSALPMEQLEEAAKSIVVSLAEAVSVALAAQDQMIHSKTKLFFVFLQSIRPRGESVPRDQAHPLVNVLAHVWPLVERVMTQCSHHDVIMQEACHCISAVISLTRNHATAVVEPYLKVLLHCFQQHPMIFHLGSVRTITGLYGSGPNDAARQVLCDVLEALGGDVLTRLQDKRFLLAQPDIVGMYYDALACGLSQPALTILILQKDWIKTVLAVAMDLLPQCHHPKVLCAMLLAVARLTGWMHRVLPPSLIPATTGCKALVLQCLRPLCTSLVGCMASQASITAHSIPLLANCLQSLILLPQTREALHAAVQQVPEAYMTAEQKTDFLQDVFSQADPREFAVFIQETAQACTAQYLKSCERG